MEARTERAVAVLVGGVGIVLLTLAAVAWVGPVDERGPGVDVLAFQPDARAFEADEAARRLAAVGTATTASSMGSTSSQVPASTSASPPPTPATADTLPPALAAALAEVGAGAVRFEVARAELDATATEVLDRLGRELATHPEVVVVVRGHTDSTGTLEFNMELSARRAQVVVDRLVAAGAHPAQLVAVGVGPTEPVADNATDEGRRANRRSEVVEGRSP